MNGAHAASHLDDGDLVRYLDGEGSDAERRGWERHVGACDRCARRTAEVQHDSHLLTEWLARAAFEDELPDRTEHQARESALTLEPGGRESGGRESGGQDAGGIETGRPNVRRSGWSPWLKAAAAIAVIAGPLAAFPPLRGWVAERVAPPTEEAAVTAADAGSPVPQPVVRFVPDPGVFTVQVEGRGGSLAVGRAAGDAAELRLTGEAPDAVVAATGVRLRSLQPDATHTLLLPDYVTGVRVLVGERAILIEGADLDRGEVIPLQ